MVSFFTVALAVTAFSSARAAPVAYGKFASSLESQAQSLSGNYYIENVDSGKRISFNRDGDVPNLGLTDDGSTVLVSKVKDDWVKFEPDDSGKCFSAQWDFDNGLDHAATLYKCCPSAEDCDNGNKDMGKLNYEKQSYLLVPVGSSSVKTAASTSERKRSLVSRAAMWMRGEKRDEILAGSNTNSAGSAFGSALGSALGTASSSSDGTFYIVAVDHIQDMRTRVVTGQIKSASGGLKSLALADIDEGDKSQQWKFYSA